MYTNVKQLQVYLNKAKFGIFVLFIWMFLYNGYSFSETSSTLVNISNSSQYSLSVLKDISNGLTDFFGIINRKVGSKATNINNKDNKLVILSMSFNQLSSSPNSLSNNIDPDEDIEPAVTSEPLVYPNPFRQSTQNGAILSYDLSKDFSFEIHIYNMLSQRVFKQTFQEGGPGARKGANRLQINQESLGGYLLSSGVYFYVFIHNQDVLAKGKMVVKP